MSTRSSRGAPAALGSLLHALDELGAPATPEQLEALVAESGITESDVREFVHFAPDGYRRNPVAQTESYDLLVLCWAAGQASPIHDHAGSACAFKVLQGTCSETTYRVLPSGRVSAAAVRRFAKGAVVVSHDRDTHRVANLDPTGGPLVTLHLYSPPLRSMRTDYELEESIRSS